MKKKELKCRHCFIQDRDQKDRQQTMELELHRLRLEICSLKIRSVCVSNPDSKRKRYKYSPSNRIKFQKKMSSKNNSPNLLSQNTSQRYQCPHDNCGKSYKLEGGLKNHLSKVHGAEDTLLGESKFDPQETSTSSMTDNERPLKRKRPSDDFVSDTDDENFEDALRSKEARADYVGRLNLQRDVDLGYDIESAAEDTMIGVQITDTQTLLKNLADTIETSKDNNTTVRAGLMTANDSMELGINNNVELKAKDDTIKMLQNLIHEKDTKIMDMEVIKNEQADMLDDKDRKLKDLRKVVKLKQSEIADLVKDKELSNIKLHQSPAKEALKVEAEKAQRHILNQNNRIRNLEKQTDELTKHVKFLEKEQPDVVKLKKSVKESLDRAEHYTREREGLHNTIAQLKKKIPCYNVATCDLGKRCQNSHVLKYSMQLNNLKTVPCVHFIDNRCKYSAEDCKYSHEEKYLNGKQRKQFLENRMLEDISEEEMGGEYFEEEEVFEPKYAVKTARQGPPRSKKMRRTESSDRSESSYNSEATRYFPEPVPATRRRSSTHSSPRRDSSKRSYTESGNARGARTQRSSQVSPKQRGGSRQRGARGSSSRRTRSPVAGSSRGRSWSPPAPRRGRGRSIDGSRRRSDRR